MALTGGPNHTGRWTTSGAVALLIDAAGTGLGAAGIGASTLTARQAIRSLVAFLGGMLGRGRRSGAAARRDSSNGRAGGGRRPRARAFLN